MMYLNSGYTKGHIMAMSRRLIYQDADIEQIKKKNRIILRN